MLDFIKGKKTVIINGLVVVLVAIGYLFPESVLPSPESLSQTFDLSVNAAVGVLAVINLVLRAVTTTSVFNKE